MDVLMTFEMILKTYPAGKKVAQIIYAANF